MPSTNYRPENVSKMQLRSANRVESFTCESLFYLGRQGQQFTVEGMTFFNHTASPVKFDVHANRPLDFSQGDSTPHNRDYFYWVVGANTSSEMTIPFFATDGIVVERQATAGRLAGGTIICHTNKFIRSGYDRA
jgi:hypothetical protein